MDPAFTLGRLSTYLPRFYMIADQLVTEVIAAIAGNASGLIDMKKIGSPFTIGEKLADSAPFSFIHHSLRCD